jgi:hypothetical protein
VNDQKRNLFDQLQNRHLGQLLEYEDDRYVPMFLRAGGGP